MNPPTGRNPMVIRSIPDAIAAVPYLLGFHPSESLVVIGYDGPHNMCAIRVDLPARDDRAETAATAERVVSVLGDNGFRRALILGYGPADQVDAAASTIWDGLAAHGLSLTDAARVADDRWWSLTCVDAECCAPGGNPYDSSLTVVAAQATLAGKVALTDRTELARSIAPVTGKARAAMHEATARAEARLKSWAVEGLSQSQFHQRMLQEGQSLLIRLRGDEPPTDNSPYRHSTPEPKALYQRPTGSNAQHPSAFDRSPPPTRKPPTNSAGRPSDDDVAWLSVLLTNLRVRDEAWVRIDEEQPDDDIDFWRDVLRRVDEPYATAPACLLAYVAYVSGDGGLANIALERADPDYSMATLLGWAFEAGAPPSLVRLNMTPEDLAAAHATQDAHSTTPGREGLLDR
ncbi:DUF4192 domain-containing protein [Actinomadura rugatobispora]|uniref:DUF4192 domain-containing protein n=1 Tax=Actinomadura rugatobispora TaxID=1994 RepID=A0ABW0ZZ35_9ACTN|nr:DUF4192 domain-containing protein [Actinomadura rugatobispora]